MFARCGSFNSLMVSINNILTYCILYYKYHVYHKKNMYIFFENAKYINLIFSLYIQ